MTLSTSQATGGDQSATQSPQTSAPSTTGTASPESGQIQPGTTSSLLQSQGGTTLHPGALTTVSLAAPAGSTAATQTTTPRHINGALLVFSLLLFAIAIGLFWTTNKSVNKTTK
ncbi:MAG TPA: hypothetical protein VF401_00550 [Candidatus Saccharimonadales bacterium]